MITALEIASVLARLGLLITVVVWAAIEGRELLRELLAEAATPQPDTVPDGTRPPPVPAGVTSPQGASSDCHHA